MSVSFKVNGKKHLVTENLDMPLLWYLREDANLIGTKFGCGIGQCGACTVHFNGNAVRSCQLKLEFLEGADIITIEGLSENGEHPVQQAWKEIDVPQCGYCQTGQIMATAALLKTIEEPTDEDIDKNITNICRCGTYVRIRKAIHLSAKLAKNVG